MDYEKKYKEALGWMREMYPCLTDSLQEDAEHYFPELRESEDERIRKCLSCLTSLDQSLDVIEDMDLTRQQLLTWLEKQKEQNGEDEEYTDFTIYHPLKNGKGEYECIPYSFYGSLTSFSGDKDLIDFLRTCFYTEEECNEWIEQQKEQKPAPKFRVGDVMRTKQEAAEGITDGLPVVVSINEDDYICNNETISITDQEEYEFPPMNTEQKPADDSGTAEPDYGICDDYIPASLHLAMARHGWYAGHHGEDEKFVLERKEYAARNWPADKDNLTQEQPAEWSEEDERILKGIIGLIDHDQHYGVGNKEMLAWLKSLRPQPHWKPSEEQMYALAKAVTLYGGGLDSLYQDLKKLM